MIHLAQKKLEKGQNPGISCNFCQKSFVIFLCNFVQVGARLHTCIIFVFSSVPSGSSLPLSRAAFSRIFVASSFLPMETRNLALSGGY